MSYVLLVWIHILAAATWVGGALFMVFVLAPAMRHPRCRPIAGDLLELIGSRFRWVGWTCLGILVSTGSMLLARHGVGMEQIQSAAFWRSGFGHTVGFKLLFVGGILVLSAVHDFYVGPRARVAMQRGAAEASRFRRLAGGLGRVTVLLALGAILMGVSIPRGVTW